MADRSRSRSRSRSPAPEAAPEASPDAAPEAAPENPPKAAASEAGAEAPAGSADVVPHAEGSVVDINAGSGENGGSAATEEFELYVGNLSWETRDADLVTEMGKSGKVSSGWRV